MGTDTLTVPIFPLPDAVFFPHTLMPLHVFEPRYKDMITDVLAGDQRLGIVQLRPGWDEDYYGAPPVYKMLGVGEIIDHHQMEDGRYDIIVQGMFRAHILSEAMHGDYRTAEVEVIHENLEDTDAEEVMWVHGRLFELYHKLSAALPDTVRTVQPILGESPSPGALIDAMASIFVENAYDRQGILSERDIARRQRLLRVQLRSILRAGSTPD